MTGIPLKLLFSIFDVGENVLDFLFKVFTLDGVLEVPFVVTPVVNRGKSDFVDLSLIPILNTGSEVFKLTLLIL